MLIHIIKILYFLFLVPPTFDDLYGCSSSRRSASESASEAAGEAASESSSESSCESSSESAIESDNTVRNDAEIAIWITDTASNTSNATGNNAEPANFGSNTANIGSESATLQNEVETNSGQSTQSTQSLQENSHIPDLPDPGLASQVTPQEGVPSEAGLTGKVFPPQIMGHSKHICDRHLYHNTFCH